jgi:hypothetical protein
MYIVKSRFFGETRAGINDEKRAVWAELHGSEMLTKFIKLDTRLMEIQESLSKGGVLFQHQTLCDRIPF